MSFLYPWFLFALSALAIPLAIHLFDFRNSKTIYFTNVKFLKQVVLQVNKGLKIKHLLVLIARMLFLLFLVLTFAQPIINTNNSKVYPSEVVSSVYVDNSLSMQGETAEGDLLQTSVKVAEGIATKANFNSKFQFLDNTFSSSDQLVISKDKLKDRLTELTLSNESRSANEIFDKQKHNLTRTSNNAKANLFWISDFQKSNFYDINTLKLDSNQQLNLMPLATSKQNNVFVDSVWLSNPFLMQSESNELVIKIFNSGDEPIEDFKIKFFIDNVPVSSAVVSILAGQYTLAKINFSISSVSTKLCMLAIEDQPITFDNNYYFVLHATPSINIVSIGDNPNRAIEKVFANESFFKMNAFGFNTIDYGKLKTAQLIVIEGVDKINNLLWDYLNKHISNGGTLLLIPSASATTSTTKLIYQKHLGFKPTMVENAGLSPAISMDKPDIKNPFFSNIFESIKDNLDLPTAKALITNLPGSKILELKNEVPLLTEVTKGTGRIFLLATELEDSYTTLYKHALFVPIMYKIATKSISSQQQLAFSLNQNIVNLFIDNQTYTDLFTLENGNKNYVPEQKIVGNSLMIYLPKEQLDAGYYYLKHKNDTVETFALNYDKAESKLQYYSTTELKEIFSNQKNVKVFEGKSSDKVIMQMTEQEQGIALWKYCLILSLLFLAVEVVLIRWL